MRCVGNLRGNPRAYGNHISLAHIRMLYTSVLYASLLKHPPHIFCQSGSLRVGHTWQNQGKLLTAVAGGHIHDTSGVRP